MTATARSRSDWRDFNYIAGRFLAPYWPLTLLLVVMSFLAATLTSIYPLLLAPALDAGIAAEPPPVPASLAEVNLNNLGALVLAWFGGSFAPGPWLVVGVSVALFTVVGVAAALLEFVAQMVSSAIASRAYRDQQTILYRHLLGLDLAFFLHSRVGELSNRFVVDVGETISSLDLAIRQALQALLQVLIYGWLLFNTSPILAAATIGISALHLVVNRLVGGRLRRHTAERLDLLGAAGGALQEAFTGIRVIKSFAAEQFEGGRFSALAARVQRASMAVSFFKHGETPLRRITDTLALGIVLLLAFRATQTGEMTFQGFVLFMVVVRLMIAPISAFAQSLTRLQAGLGSAQRVLDLLHRQPDLADGDTVPGAFAREIRLEGVTFGYDPAQPVLRDISLSLRRGELLAVVGASGAGKSTLIDLILRLYDPQAGRVLLDGVDIRTLRQADYRRLFGVVAQESLLFNDTVRANIEFGRSTGAPVDLERAARIANADGFIAALPQGYDTVVGDRGTRLSGGQRQRLAIARAIYAQPPILVLDEATSALDSEAERQVQNAIDRVLENATAIVVAHRLSTIVHADRIVVMDGGRIAAIGPHADLLRDNSSYRRLCELQFGAAALSPTPMPAA